MISHSRWHKFARECDLVMREKPVYAEKTWIQKKQAHMRPGRESNPDTLIKSECAIRITKQLHMSSNKSILAV